MPEHTQRILGLDLGTSSIGWCLIEGNPKPESLLATGVRIFPEGMDRTKGEKSLNQDRRMARSLRRQTYRRVRRRQKLLHALQDAGLLPADETKLTALLRTEDPYSLRARALDEKLDLWQVGRALYHLGQRRGYLSNRKTGKDKEDGKVADGINGLQNEMQATNSRTLGEHFHRLDPHQQRIRGRYTSRKMYEAEFNLIWETQSPHHPKSMDVANRLIIHQAIFEQRPLKIQKHLVGICEFEPGRKRAPLASLAAQEFRLWQTLNNLKILSPEGEENFLSDLQRSTLYEKLATAKQLSWEKVRAALNLHEGYRFNLEKMRKSGLLGNQTAAIAANAITKTNWKALGHKGQEQLTYDLINIETEEALLQRLRHKYRFEPEQIDKLVKKSLELPKGYLHLSSKAARNITKALKRMATADNRGLTYDQACLEAGYVHTKPPEKGNKSVLPFPGKAAKDKKNKHYQHNPELTDSTVSVDGLRNPMVERAIYQLRRVVNAFIAEYGKPDIIRVEMARDLKASRKQREDYQRRQRLNEEANQRADEALREYGYPNPTRADKLKYRLWEECGQTCPYTGKPINIDSLFGEQPQFDIEHIIPYSRCLDDSYMNKTLCYRAENEVKGNLTPWEAYHADKTKYEQILQRAKKLPYPKFKRFAKDAIKELPEFVSQQLNETRFISRKAVEYLQQLGCKVEPVKGGTTALLRRAWGLNNILDETGEKTRLDHRHHAVDALVCALTDRAAVQKISRYASLSDNRLRVEGYPSPIKDLRQQAETAVKKIVVSHKSQRKARGPLHEDTFYSYVLPPNNDLKKYIKIRKKLATLNPQDLEYIVDSKIRELAIVHLNKNGRDIKKAFGQTPTTFGFKNNEEIITRPINKVRLSYPLNVRRIGRTQSPRYVKPGNNHHIEIFENKTTGKWIGRIVPLMDVYIRKSQKKPIINMTHKDGHKYICALHKNDMIEINLSKNNMDKLNLPKSKQFCFIEEIDYNNHRIILRLHHDADKKNKKNKINGSMSALQNGDCKIITITPIGKIQYK